MKDRSHLVLLIVIAILAMITIIQSLRVEEVEKANRFTEYCTIEKVNCLYLNWVEQITNGIVGHDIPGAIAVLDEMKAWKDSVDAVAKERGFK